jgi:hypothetical protein
MQHQLVDPFQYLYCKEILSMFLKLQTELHAIEMNLERKPGDDVSHLY